MPIMATNHRITRSTSAHLPKIVSMEVDQAFILLLQAYPPMRKIVETLLSLEQLLTLIFHLILKHLA